MNRKRITAENDTFFQYLKKIYQYRSLIRVFTLKDIKSNYSQTLFGILWVIIKPLIILGMFTLFFDKLIELETENIPYPIYAFIGMTVWYYFTNIISQSGTLFNNNDLVKKIYFPKIILLFSKTLVGFFEFLVSFIILMGLMMVYGFFPSWKIIFLPLIIIMITLSGMTISIWLSALSIKFRDLQHIVPQLVNFGIWFTPVFYPTTIIPSPYQDWLYYINPLASVIHFFRWILLGTQTPNLFYFISFIFILIFFCLGVRFFSKLEKNMADYV